MKRIKQTTTKQNKRGKGRGKSRFSIMDWGKCFLYLLKIVRVDRLSGNLLSLQNLVSVSPPS